jgi:vancomycin resistance protein VanW
MPRKPISQYHPILYFLAVWVRRCYRYFAWYFDGRKYARHQQIDRLPYRVKKHQSVLVKKLGDSDRSLQINKVTNLRIAVQHLDGLIIRPGEVFSFCRRVGLPARRKGYLEGMELSFGKARAGIGGGLCQISNLIHWLVLHSPLTVTERYHHSFDPFPDDGRVLPFGSGATIFYNYRDYQFTNNTPYTFQIRLWFSKKCLEGELRVDSVLDYAYHVYEQNHSFLKIDEQFYRQNEIWRQKKERFKSGEILDTELICKNFAKVIYVPDEYVETSVGLK